jgi:putative FmdB family regulatory protein
MPIYVYECPQCHHQFELMQSFSARPVESCPECSSKVRKLLFPPAVIFKGSGFYATEYGRSKNFATDLKNESSPTSGTDSKTESKTDSKTAPASGTSEAQKPAACPVLGKGAG